METCRLFYAFELDDSLRAQIARAQQSLVRRLGARDLRWTLPSDWHITVLFLGEYAEDFLPRFVDSGDAAVASVEPFEIVVGGLGRFPPGGPPRVVWAGGAEDEARTASRICAGLRQRLRGLPLDVKPFRPHITLARVQAGAGGALIDAAIQELGKTLSGTLAVDRLVLMQTMPAGAGRTPGVSKYSVVRTFPIGQ
ncbi:MAG: RNA 2',3'-cyclic phosphodiesterase [Capsulimonadaceae bacterium]